MDTDVEFTVNYDEVLEGFMVYFNLHLGREILTNYDPRLNYNDPKMCEQCWDPIIFPMIAPKDVEQNQKLKVRISCRNGILKLTHDYNNTEQRSLKIDQKVYQFLMDNDYLNEMEFYLQKAIKGASNLNNVADFMPFPHVGINMLKENKIKKLYCCKAQKKLVETIAEWNCIDLALFEFVEEIEDVLKTTTKFDVILLQPVTQHNTLKEDHLKCYNDLKACHLTERGVLLPYKVELWAKVINSHWIDRVSRVKQVDQGKYGIEKHINEYSTKLQYDFVDPHFDELSVDSFRIATIKFDGGLHEKIVPVPLNENIDEPKTANGILQMYKTYFIKNSVPISTYRRKSFNKFNCFVDDIDIERFDQTVEIEFIQNQFTFRCSFVK